MPPPRRPARARKPVTRYHHGDLKRAMRLEAVRLIQSGGIEALTLRAVGERLGVSRTALYRHFADKQALLGAVAADGFATLRRELAAAWEAGSREPAGFNAMGEAYVRFALQHPAHYRVMFGGLLVDADVDCDVDGDSTDAFGILVQAIVEQQRAGTVRRDDPRQLALYVWSVVHGIAMLALDGVLPRPADAHALVAFANARLRTGIGVVRRR